MIKHFQLIPIIGTSIELYSLGNYNIFGSGASTLKTTDNFFIYPDSINSLESDIKKLIKIDTLNVAGV